MLGKLRLQCIDLLRGTTVLDKLKELTAHQYLPPGEVAAIKQKKLDALFTKAKQYTKYYRGYACFDEVPVMTKELVRKHTPDLVSSGYKGKLHKKLSGGSTGIPLAYYTTTESQSYLWAGIILSWQIAGYKLGDRVAIIAGTSLIKTGIGHRVFYGLFNIDTYPAAPLNDATLAIHAARMRKRKTAIIYGYANVVNELADYVKKQPGGFFPHLKGIVCTAEVLEDKTRANIELAFGVKVINQYGCNEGGTSAFDCEHGAMHLLDSKIVYEEDEEKNLVCTDLANEGFIMLKYLTGDILEFSDSACKCKRTSPVIKQVIGRTSDIVVDRHANRLHCAFFYFMFKFEKSIIKYQVSFDENVITVNLQTNQLLPLEYYDSFLEKVKQHVSFEHYHLVLNLPFILNKNGKHKQVVDNRKVGPFSIISSAIGLNA